MPLVVDDWFATVGATAEEIPDFNTPMADIWRFHITAVLRKSSIGFLVGR
jgi:hypothetical protein